MMTLLQCLLPSGLRTSGPIKCREGTEGVQTPCADLRLTAKQFATLWVIQESKQRLHVHVG